MKDVGINVIFVTRLGRLIMAILANTVYQWLTHNVEHNGGTPKPRQCATLIPSACCDLLHLLMEVCMLISWREVNGKIVICKDGVFMALKRDQIPQLKAVLLDIESGTKELYQEDTRKPK